MKKLAFALLATSFIAFGHGSVNAQSTDPQPNPETPVPDDRRVECGESDGRVDNDGDGIADSCLEFYVNVQPPEPELDVDGFVPVCIGDAPFIAYDIVAIGFTPAQPFEATLTISALDGTPVDTVTVDTPAGQILYPGASVDANGNATDWPGWVQTNTGEWIRDETDDFLRDGLNITVEVNPTADTTVSYPPSTAACADPPQQASQPPQPLPATGSGTALPLQIGALLLAAGSMVLVATKRRRHVAAAV